MRAASQRGTNPPCSGKSALPLRPIGRRRSTRHDGSPRCIGRPVKATPRRAIELIEKRGLLLVFPIENRPEPRSLWSELYPRSPMRWAWDEGADPRVVSLWHLREALARSRKVVYAKWFRGRAMFFSRDVFRAMLASLRATGGLFRGLSRDAQELLELLDDNSPQSTKELRRAAGLQGRMLETQWTHALKALWSRMLIVGAGEVDDGAFPSLAVGSTKLLFEELWNEAARVLPGDEALLEGVLQDAPSFRKELEKVRRGLQKPDEPAIPMTG